MTATKWIAVKDKLPEEYTDVIVTDGEQVWLDNMSFEDGRPWWMIDCHNTITHWIPMPEPPEGVLHV